MKEKSPVKMYSNKKFLSTHPYWDSSTSWYVGIEEGWGERKERLEGNIKLSDCYKSIELDISEDKHLVLEKLDNLIYELQSFRESYLDIHDRFEGGVREENSGTECVELEEWLKTLTKVCELGGNTYYLHPEEKGEVSWEDSKEWVKSLNIYEGCSVEMPSLGVLRECYKNESLRVMFDRDYFYWASEEDSASHAWDMYMYSGHQNCTNKTNTTRSYVRPVVVVPKSA